jgi:HAD superfamily hydrolase (TIGR01549 family)
MTLRGVIFDMGGTLMYFMTPGQTFEDVEKAGALAVYETLRARGHTLPPQDEALEIAWQHIWSLWMTLVDAYDPAALTLEKQLHAVAAKWETNSLTPDDVRALSDAYTSAIRASVSPLDGAADTLRALRDQGLRVGLISNTFWPGDYHRKDLEHWELMPYLEHLVFSADVAAWKPYTEVFQMSLDALELEPDEAIYVGDSLFFDVYGAQRAGLRGGVWIEQPERMLPEGLEVTPDATIRRLPELLDVVAGWR